MPTKAEELKKLVEKEKRLQAEIKERTKRLTEKAKNGNSDKNEKNPQSEG